MKEHIQAIVTLLSLINPGVCVLLFARAESDRPTHARYADASRAAVAIGIILLAAALLGTRLLHVFGISLDAFMVAGGGVLAWMGFNMLSGRPMAPGNADSGALAPLILFAASPGTITGVITLSAAQPRNDFPASTLVAVSVAVLVTWIVLMLSARFSGQQGGDGLARDTLTRFMGLIVLAMGVQFALTGFQAFPGPAGTAG
ncbi:MarC family protein [Dokdonella sp.]|uniref:MarC family protein n=1 Tax=Dokdonella sp. TaxID=2291710 RepID=UPI0035285717